MSNETSYISTSFAIATAVNDSMNDDSVRGSALGLMMAQPHLDEEEFRKFLFEYTANVIATTAELVTKVFMTEDQINAMMAEQLEMSANAMNDE